MAPARRYLAFDIETAADLPGDASNWRTHRPLGITCAATLAVDAPQATVFHAQQPNGSPAPRMTAEQARALVEFLERQVAAGYTILTWNGLGFDFDVLAEESGALATCQALALAHVDMMFHVVCDRGFPVALDKAAQALGVPGKPPGMSGAMAPQLWAQGQHQQVLDYVAQDVRAALDIAQACESQHKLRWLTRKGTPGTMPLPRGWLSVREAIGLPMPDTAWMSAPLSRSDFTAWLADALPA